MNIFCVDADHHRLMKLWRAAMVAAPNANVQKFDAIGDAVRYAMSVRCDVLLADLNTGGAAWTGIDVAKEIQKTNQRANIIFLSSEPFASNQQCAQGIGISGYIQQPYDKERLAEEIDHLRYPLSLVGK